MAAELGVPLAYLLADSDVLANVILAAARMPHAEQRRLATELKERAKRSSGAEQAECDSD
ncbi:hypothetical protein D3C72_2301840 [compost metagenome]